MIEREMSSGPDALVFHVCVDEHHPDLSYNGITRETDWVFVQPPDAKSVLISPPWSVQLTVQVSYTSFLHHLSSMPEIVQWITRLNRNGDFLKSTLIADRLRDTGRLAIEFSKQEIWTDDPDAVAKNLMLSLIIGLTLQWLPNNAFPTYPKPNVLNRFQTMRRLLLENHEALHDDGPRAVSKLGSRRSIEKAFSELIDMGPVMYARVLRLNRARRKFRDPAFSGQTIGDIAAEEGFWEWSRFTSYYRKQFGELPSETRSRSPRFKACA
nr:helix-turn-helix domain-containing protein [uncultured Roseibium sp.]